MKIEFLLDWSRAPAFKSPPIGELFRDYLGRIARFMPAAALPWREPRGSGLLWVCHPSPASRAVSSEELARFLERAQVQGAGCLGVLVGGPDGFSEARLRAFKPNLLWSFGPLTLPHELAAVVAAEQFYRACTILKGLPYHLGH